MALSMTLLAARATAAELTLMATQDAPIFGDDGGVSGISFSTHSNGAGYTLYVGTNGTGSARRALIQFDLSSLPAGAVVSQATLVLTLDREPNAVNQQLSLHKLTTAWTTGSSNSDEAGSPGQGSPATAGDATWYYASYPGSSTGGVLWGTPGGDFDSTVSASTWVGPLGSNGAVLAYQWQDQGMADDVNAWLQRPASNHGWVLIGNEHQTQSVKRFISREALGSDGEPMDAALRPHLVLVYEVGGSAGGSTGSVTSHDRAPWGKLRRRAGLAHPRPCCFQVAP